VRALALGLALAGALAAQPKLAPVDETGYTKLIAANKGKVVLVDFWATWCKPCREEMPNLLKVWKRHAGKSFRLILLSADDVGDLETKVRPALRGFGVGFTTYIMADTAEDAFINGLNASWSGALPATFVYDREGTQVDMKVGEQTYRKFEEAVSKVLRR
jgi:thiol-disulfide isomerase/thioredoxin